MQLDHNVVCRFRFVCNQQWDDLARIPDDPKQRFCNVCKSSVHLTRSYEELDVNIAAKRCVALFLEVPNASALEFIGDVQPSVGAYDSFLLRPVDELEMSAHVTEKLKNGNVLLVGDLAICTEKALVETFHFNAQQLREICEYLAAFGLTTGMSLNQWEEISSSHR